MSWIQLKNVSKKFDDLEIIPPLNLEIKDGEFVVFVGPSGCGKSTLLRLIAGLEDVSSGQIFINGEDATEVSPAKRKSLLSFSKCVIHPTPMLEREEKPMWRP